MESMLHILVLSIGVRYIRSTVGLYIVCSRNNKKPETSESFWTWNVGERLVVYLAICDICYGISHTIDHTYVVFTKSNAPVSLLHIALTVYDRNSK
jgi:hypothetical protein